MASNAAFENGSRLPEPCPPKAGSWCSCNERRPHVRLTVLGNGPRRANGLGPWIPKQLETFDVHVMRPLDQAPRHVRIARRLLALRPAHSRGHQVVTVIRRLQTFRLLHACF